MTNPAPEKVVLTLKVTEIDSVMDRNTHKYDNLVYLESEDGATKYIWANKARPAWKVGQTLTLAATNWGIGLDGIYLVLTNGRVRKS